VERPTVAEPFDRRDVTSVARDREEQAGVDSASRDQHRARSALTVVAALLRPGQVEVLAEEVEERGAVVDREVVYDAVDGEGDRAVER
jgi:hypothetical protein